MYISVFRQGIFSGQIIIVTGGGGIGRCTAHELVSLGATVALVGRKPEKLEKVRDEIAEAAAFITGACLRVDGGAPNARHPWKLIPHERSKPFNGFPLSTVSKILQQK